MYALEPFDGGLKNHDILEFAGQYGLLTGDQVMRVRDLIYTAKYLSLFAQAVDEGRKHQARQVFNERVAPHMTVKLVGSKSGKPTANWSLEVEPTDLIAVAWLQMAQELTQDKRLKKCNAPDCLEWFPDRSNKRFCNNRCKMAFHHA
jgi:predicted RNA-binding Zn ribbon-like protein